MKSESTALLVTVYINSGDHYHGAPLYAAIVHLCHERGIAGATVFRAMEGYGSSGRLHTTRLLELGENLPVRIEIVDSREQIEALLPHLDAMVTQGLITVAEVRGTKVLNHTSAVPGECAECRQQKRRGFHAEDSRS